MVIVTPREVVVLPWTQTSSLYIPPKQRSVGTTGKNRMGWTDSLTLHCLPMEVMTLGRASVTLRQYCTALHEHSRPKVEHTKASVMTLFLAFQCRAE